VKVNVKAAELNAWLPTEPLPVPENVMESGLAAAIPANKILVKNRRYGNGVSPGKYPFPPNVYSEPRRLNRNKRSSYPTNTSVMDQIRRSVVCNHDTG